MEPEVASEDFSFLALWVVVVDISQFPVLKRSSKNDFFDPRVLWELRFTNHRPLNRPFWKGRFPKFAQSRNASLRCDVLLQPTM